MKRYDIAIFDLDGTLLDTLDDIAAALNRTIAKHGFPERTRQQVEASVGNGSAYLLKSSCPEDADAELLKEILEEYRADYRENCDVLTRAYPGVEELLRRLKIAGVPAAVNTNKPQPAAEKLVQAHFPGRAELVLGENPEMPRKPHPAGVWKVLDTFGINPEDALYVGDSITDYKTAKNAGVDFAWLTWGYQDPDEMPEDAKQRAFSDAGALCNFILGQAR